MSLENPSELKKKNQIRLRHVFLSTFSLGINLETPSSRKDLLKLITIILLAASCLDVYGQICYILRYKYSILIMAEAICTMLQALISIFKLSYVLFVQQQFYTTMKIISSHELVYSIKLLAQSNLIKVSSFMLSFPALYPFWEHKMHKLPQYFILTFAGFCAAFIAGIGAISFDGLFIIIAMHCVAILRILHKIIKFSTSSNVPKELHLDYLHQCIEYYEKTFQFYKEFNNLYLHISLMQFLFSLLTHGVVMFQGSVGLGKDILMVLRMIMFMAASGYEVVIYCLNGQLVTSESEKLPNSWFQCEWYNESKEFKQLIKMMIIRSNRSFRMNASWFSTMSLETLLKLFKTSGSYFLLLRNLVEYYMAVVQLRFHKLIHLVETNDLINRFELLSKETSYNKELRKDATKILNQSWKFGSRQFNFYLVSCITIFCYYNVLAMSTNVYHTTIGTANYTNIFSTAVYFPFWQDKMNHSLQFYFLYILVVSGMSIAVTGAVCFDGFFIFTACHGSALIQILKKAIPFTTSPKVPKSLRLGYLRQCIQQYERTYQYCAELNDLYLQITLAQFLLSLVILGLVMFQGTVGFETDYVLFLKMILYISAAGYEVIIFCLNGQSINSESEGITNAWYECEWYNESKEFKKLIQMIMMRSNKTIVMKASWFSTMSLPTLLSIIRTSGSYFLLLRNVTSE
ncbi:odorant receptor 63a-like [Episyrphus balteatus]|uniref:odorant receptor 63a-like n=1 Tax=Episyrphus balteatus TaxID=286459 RepID=UPI0024855DAD|nr:odorant receptor 63a-like [Episyrphus balteatus]